MGGLEGRGASLLRERNFLLTRGRVKVTCLWPGLPELWVRGNWRGLGPAVVFTVWLNAALIARFCYSDWIDPWALRAVGMCLAGWWLVASYRALRSWPKWTQPLPRAAAATDPYRDAQAAYLRGQWLECEQHLRRCLATDPRDAPALLLLSSVYRRIGRLYAARQTLDRLSQLEAGDPWWLEVRRERARLIDARPNS